MKVYFLGFIIFLFNAGNTFAQNGNLSISRAAGPWPIHIKTCSHDAGAICYLTWRNKQFVDDFDHGRQIQSALQYNGGGEAVNPTEAGGSYDGHNPSPSSSRLLTSSSTATSLSTKTNMAFWKMVNGRRLSNTTLTKNVAIGPFNYPHAIQYLTTFRPPLNETYSKAVIEIVTGYMPFEFSAFWTYDPRTRVLRSLSYGPGGQPLPIIFSTQDRGWAMGIYSPNINYYSRIRYNTERVSKWSHVKSYNNPVPGRNYNFQSYVIVGSLDNVKVTMNRLYQRFGS